MERAFWVAWSRIAGIGPILLFRLYRHFGSLAEAWDASRAELESIEGFGPQNVETAIKERSHLDPEHVLRQHQHQNPQFWTPADSDYPRLLLEIPDPPPVLYYRGIVEPLENQGVIPAIAMVGTRSPSEYGKSWTRKISKALAEAGFVVVSGLAEGVDTEAHISCLVAGGRTLAVLGTGVDVTYPWKNRGLSQRIEQQGLLLSEYPAGTQPDRAYFPRRNRIVAGLCRATLVLEAPQKSGALITAQLANDYHRDVYALPGSLDNACAKGCLDLINTGAQMILGEDALLDLLGAIPHLAAQQSATQLPLFQPELTLEPALKQVLQLISIDAIAFDQLAQQVEMTTGEVLSALTQLELMGLISELPGKMYRRG